MNENKFPRHPIKNNLFHPNSLGLISQFGQNSNTVACAFRASTYSIISILRQNIMLLTNSIKAISVLQRKEALAALAQTCAFPRERGVMGYSYCSLLFG